MYDASFSDFAAVSWSILVSFRVSKPLPPNNDTLDAYKTAETAAKTDNFTPTSLKQE